jgi:hypothetical protein
VLIFEFLVVSFAIIGLAWVISEVTTDTAAVARAEEEGRRLEARRVWDCLADIDTETARRLIEADRYRALRDAMRGSDKPTETTAETAAPSPPVTTLAPRAIPVSPVPRITRPGAGFTAAFREHVLDTGRMPTTADLSRKMDVSPDLVEAWRESVGLPALVTAFNALTGRSV